MSFIVFIFDIFRHMPSAMNNSFHDEIRYHDPISLVVMVPEKDVVYYNIYWDITMCNFTIIDIETSNFKTADDNITFAKIVSNSTNCQKICIVLSMGRLKIVKHVKWGTARIR